MCFAASYLLICEFRAYLDAVFSRSPGELFVDVWKRAHAEHADGEVLLVVLRQRQPLAGARLRLVLPDRAHEVGGALGRVLPLRDRARDHDLCQECGDFV